MVYRSKLQFPAEGKFESKEFSTEIAGIVKNWVLSNPQLVCIAVNSAMEMVLERFFKKTLGYWFFAGHIRPWQRKNLFFQYCERKGSANSLERTSRSLSWRNILCKSRHFGF